MKNYLSAILILLCCFLGITACSTPSWLSNKEERKTYAMAPGQTGTYMPRLVETRAQKRVARARRQKAEKKREVEREKRERDRDDDQEREREPERVVKEDEDFVTRGGFR